jgi:cell division protein FtsN
VTGPSPQYNPRRQNKRVEKKPKRSGASPMRGESARMQVPAWLWVVGGVAVGVFISFLLRLSHAPAPVTTAIPAPIKTPVAMPDKKVPPAPEVSKGDVKVADKASDKAAPDDTQTVTKFDFYTLLPEREVIVPNEREAIKAVDKQKAQPGGSAAPAGNEQLLLQVGSFRSAQEAERRRTQIVALNLEAKIESVRANGDTWYRVQAGPFTSREQLTKARDQMSAVGIESLLLKQKPQG